MKSLFTVVNLWEFDRLLLKMVIYSRFRDGKIVDFPKPARRKMCWMRVSWKRLPVASWNRCCVSEIPEISPMWLEKPLWFLAILIPGEWSIFQTFILAAGLHCHGLAGMRCKTFVRCQCREGKPGEMYQAAQQRHWCAQVSRRTPNHPKLKVLKCFEAMFKMGSPF